MKLGNEQKKKHEVSLLSYKYIEHFFLQCTDTPICLKKHPFSSPKEEQSVLSQDPGYLGLYH